MDGLDVVKDAEELRYRIGLAGQSAAVDENLTGLENLEMVGRLYGLQQAEARKRTGETLERFDLADAADRPSKTYSGGMRRRLDVAASLVGAPERAVPRRADHGPGPTQPHRRLGVHPGAAGGRHHAPAHHAVPGRSDLLADQITVIDLGTVIAEGTSDELKDRIGGEVLELKVENTSQIAEAVAALAGSAPASPTSTPTRGGSACRSATEGAAALRDSSHRLDERQIRLSGFASTDRRWTTCSSPHRSRAEDGAEPEPNGGKRKRGRKKANA